MRLHIVQLHVISSSSFLIRWLSDALSAYRPRWNIHSYLSVDAITVHTRHRKRGHDVCWRLDSQVVCLLCMRVWVIVTFGFSAGRGSVAAERINESCCCVFISAGLGSTYPSVQSTWIVLNAARVVCANKWGTAAGKQINSQTRGFSGVAREKFQISRVSCISSE